MAFTLRSPVFGHGQPIPAKYTADGEDVSPPLEWSQPPQGAKSFLLTVEDPDAPAGTFHHWGLYNDFGQAHYRGPAPPKGDGMHHYHFKLAALDVEALHAPAKVDVADLRSSAKGHVIGEAELVGTYER